ncbi:MAG: LexA family protein [Ginsengibacter sp.]|jgi:DNA polymerase V
MITKNISREKASSISISERQTKALETAPEIIDLNTELIEHPQSTFIIQSTGYSMINAFIPPKARLVVDRSITAKNGDIVLAMLNGELTVRYLKKNPYKCWLVPANSKFKEIEISPEMDMQICGVVTSIITDARNVKSGMM